jgi:guanine nucleotide-binding protein G(I)/G(S)/G(T) subunit beta-1
VSTFAEHTADAMFLSLKPGDRNVFASCSVDQSCKVWDIRAPSSAVQTFRGHVGDVNCVEFMPSSDANCLATCGQDSTVRLYDLRAYNELAKFGAGAAANAAKASVTAPPAAAASNIDAVDDGYTSLAFSKSGRIIFCGHDDGTLSAFDVLAERASPVFSIPTAHDRNVSCIGVSPEGNALCTGSWDGLLKIWA